MRTFDTAGRLIRHQLGQFMRDISYDAADRISAFTHYEKPAVHLPLDVTGNVVGLGGAVANYDLSGRWSNSVLGGATLTGTFNALGQRVRKYTNGGASSVTLFVYDQQGQLLGEYDSTGAALREYIWLGNTPVAMFTPAGPGNPPNMYFIHTDHIDTPRVVVERNGGAVRWMWLSEAFGSSAAEDNPTGLGAFTLPLRFPGQYFDLETGTHYNYFRDYDPWAGRYLQSDPIGLAGGLNTYAYVEGNPVSGVDPNGLQVYPKGHSPLSPRFYDTLNPNGKGSNADMTYQFGMSCNLGAAVMGLGLEAGFATSSKLDDFCFYAQLCGVAGPQLVAGGGPAYSFGDGLPSSGTTTSKGFTWFGGAGFFGGGQATVSGTGQSQFTRGGVRGQVGAGAGAGYVECSQKMMCMRR